MIIRHNFYISGLLTIFTIIFIAGLLPPAFMFPFTFKLGAEKGRFAYYIGFILFFALLGWLQSFIKNLPLGLAHFPFRSYYILILFFIGLLLYMISRDCICESYAGWEIADIIKERMEKIMK